MNEQILQDRYCLPGEKTYAEVIFRVVNHLNLGNGIIEAMMDHRIVPGGRILAACGTSDPLYNCYVIPSPEDSMDGIMASIGLMAKIMKRGGGVGVNLSTLRPRGATVYATRGTSSGAVSFGEIYSNVTGTISQGGTRRGALMLVLQCDHPDILEFIDAKRKPGVFENANLSVAITDNFMRALSEDGDVKLRHNGTVYGTLPARNIWDKLAASAHASGEPGVWFIDESRRFDSSIVCVNPCGEQPLPAYGCCNLGSLNLSRYVADGEFDYKLLSDDTDRLELLLNKVIDKSEYVTEEFRKLQQKERRIGIGTMGLADALIRMKIRYGSEQSLEVTRKIFNTIKEALERIMQKGYHRAVMSQAPTGTTATMLRTSTGIEPFFAWEYTRNSRIGSWTEKVPVYQEWLDSNSGPLPDYFVTAHDVTVDEHLAIQQVVQEIVDSGVSKTINLPPTATVEDVQYVFQSAYDRKLKGVTVFRDGCRGEQVLVREQPKSKLNKLSGTTYKLDTPAGKVRVICNSNQTPLEVYVLAGKAGSSVRAMSEALGRVISISLQNGIDSGTIAEQLSGIGGGDSVGLGPNRIISIPDAVAKAMLEEWKGDGSTFTDICPGCGQAALVYCSGCAECPCGYSKC